MSDISLAAEIARRQAECQLEIDAADAALKRFLANGAAGDLESLLGNCLVAALRMALVPDDAKADHQILYGSGEATQRYLLTVEVQ